MIGLLLSFLLALIRVCELLLVARAIISWFPSFHNSPIVGLLYSLTEPLLAPIREWLQKIPALQGFPFDFSILVVFLLLDILRMIIIRI